MPEKKGFWGLKRKSATKVTPIKESAKPSKASSHQNASDPKPNPSAKSDCSSELISSAKATDSQIESEVSETTNIVLAAAKISESLTSGSSPTSKTVKHPGPKSVKLPGEDLQDIFRKWIEDAEIPESISQQPTASSATTPENSENTKESSEDKIGDGNGNEILNKLQEMESIRKSQSHENTSASDLYHEIKESVATTSGTAENNPKPVENLQLDEAPETSAGSIGKVFNDNKAKLSDLIVHDTKTSKIASANPKNSDNVGNNPTVANSKQTEEQLMDQVTGSEESEHPSPDRSNLLEVLLRDFFEFPLTKDSIHAAKSVSAKRAL